MDLIDWNENMHIIVIIMGKPSIITCCTWNKHTEATHHLTLRHTITDPRYPFPPTVKLPSSKHFASVLAYMCVYAYVNKQPWLFELLIIRMFLPGHS